MGNRKTELLAEISQLLDQYRQEVPGRRRAWPESLKRRVLELHDHDLNYRQIAEGTNLPYYTLLRWAHEKKGPSFEVVNVVAARGRSAKLNAEVATVTDATPAARVATVTDASCDSTATVTVALPSGVRVEGVPLNFLLELLPRLGVELR
jgi:hypothetical protein